MKKGKAKTNGLLPNSLKIISSCIKTVSTNASTVVRSAGATVAASIAPSGDDHRDQVIWAGFDRLEIGPAYFINVLLLGYQTGFQVIDVEDASNFTELVSKRDGPVSFLQLLHIPAKSDDKEKFLSLHPLLMVVAGDEATRSTVGQNRTYLSASGRDGSAVSHSGTSVDSPTAVRFYSLKSNCYVKVLRFRSTVFMVRCSPLIVAVGLEMEIHCIDAVTLENKFTIPSYPVPRSGGQGTVGVNFGYGPLAVGPRWLAYASNKLLVSNTGHLSPQNLTPGISPSTSPSNGALVARYAMESSRQLAAGIITLGDKGYKTLSKYYPERQDRPLSSTTTNTGWNGRNASSEVDNAGMVIVKDVVSEAVISQFRAHSSPLCALCFDPSGTLLVTASIHGNNVNIFRIMPCTRKGSSNQVHDWNSSHVLLYKLHRGITSAVIQDISFSRYCQWISIVSSKGTCHVFVISPFGGDVANRAHGLQNQIVNPVRSLPWWSTPSFVIQDQPFPSPSPLILSVVGRIKNNSSGFLNTVSNAASFVGKANLSSGAVASVFHNSMSNRKQDISRKVNSLEYMLVYTPSGYVIQYELLPSIGIQYNDSSRNQSVSYQPNQEEELGVIFESRQWWQVCRKSDSPEREESISTTTFNCVGSMGVQKPVKSDSVKQNDRAHWFLSNAEVQINSGRLPVWQNTKIHFHAMRSVNVEGFAAGEAHIENIPCYEVDIRRKDLLPVFDHFNSIKSCWDDRAYSARKDPGASSLESGQSRDKTSDESVICLSKPASVSSTESSEGGSSRRTENLLDLDPVNCEKSNMPISHTLNELYLEPRNDQDPKLYNTFPGSCITSTPSLTVDHFDIPKLPSEKAVDFEGCFQETYCKLVEADGCNDLTQGLVDYGENDESHSGKEISDNEGEEDELLGGMFELSEEG